MNLKEARKICNEIDSKYRRNGDTVNWSDVFGSKEDMIDALRSIYIPKNRTAPLYTFIGYQYIYSFAYYVKQGWKLSEKQMKQCERLALEIKKASAISQYNF